MKRLILIAALTALSSCGSEWHLQKAISKDPLILEVDTAKFIDTIRLTTERIEFDTIFKPSKDTLTIIRDNLTVKHFYSRDSVYIYAECDTIFKEIVVERKIPYKRIVFKEEKALWFYLSISAFFMVIVLGLVLFRRLRSGN